MCMSSYMGDLTTYLSTGVAGADTAAKVKSNSDKFDLGMEDFLTLMVTELQNQSIDQTADTSEMLNQMVMMQMVTALTNMTDASIMSYAASLVGKTVTVGSYDDKGVLQEVVGTVTGTGTMDGDQVIFVNDKYYKMNEIMAVGTLPEVQESEATEKESSSDSGSSSTPSSDSSYESVSSDDVPYENQISAT